MNIYIKPIEACNLQCRHCYNGEPDCSRLPIDDKLKDFVQSLVKIKEDHENWIIFHGGEPLLASKQQLKEMASLNIPGVKKRITTNLTLPLTLERINLLLSMDDIRTSFDIGIGRFTKLKDFTRWIHNIRKLRGMGGRLDILNVCLTYPLVCEKLPGQIVRIAKRLGFRCLSFEYLCIAGRMNEHDVPGHNLSDLWLNDLYHFLKYTGNDIKIKNFENIAFGIRGEWEHYRGKACCNKVLTINANGTVGECPNSARKKIIGTLDSNPIDILRNKCQGCSRPHLTKCLTCEFFKQCRGGCEEQQWQGDLCPYPKKLAQCIARDLSEHTAKL